MNADQAQRIIAAIERKTGGRPPTCEICGGAQWDLQGFIITPLQPSLGSGFMIGGPVLPEVALVCSSCGNTKHLNLRALGALTLEPGPAQKDAAPNPDLAAGERLLGQVFGEGKEP